MFRAGAPDNGTEGIRMLASSKMQEVPLLFHLLRNFLVDGITEVFNSAFPLPENNGRAVIWCKTARFCVYTDERQRFPHLADELVHI